MCLPIQQSANTSSFETTSSCTLLAALTMSGFVIRIAIKWVDLSSSGIRDIAKISVSISRIFTLILSSSSSSESESVSEIWESSFANLSFLLKWKQKSHNGAFIKCLFRRQFWIEAVLKILCFYDYNLEQISWEFWP